MNGGGSSTSTSTASSSSSASAGGSGAGSTGSSSGGPLRHDVRTGRETTVTLRPFEVQNVSCPARWDPSSERLAVSYDITDRNSRIRNGRIRYFTTTDTGDVTIHRQRLTSDQYQHGRCYELPEGQRWDGTITEGLDGQNGTENRVGQKVTADLSPLGITVEVWNTTESEPAARVPGGHGRTEREGEWVSSGTAVTDIDAIVEARWDTDWCIPYDDPDEPNKGGAGMRIRTKNVREGTTVRLEVYRLGDFARPDSDLPYADTGYGAEDQPGLQQCIVRNNEVKRGAANAPAPRRQRGVYTPPRDLPYVLFNQYDEHWKYDGNNFYAFRVAFGDRGLSQAASQRDYEHHERECLHMRFTVLVHRAASDTDYVGIANDLHRFFRNDTRYFRSYLSTMPSTAAAWIRYYSHRYIVVVCGHAGAGCRHDDHPTRTVGTGTHAHQEKLDLYHRSFVPDMNTCPTVLETTTQAQNDLTEAQQHYGHPFGGCNHKSHVFHYVGLSPSARWLFSNRPGVATRTTLTISKKAAQAGQPWDNTDVPMGRREPRLMFYTGGCRTMLTTNFGEHFVQNETRYYHGWMYSVWISENRLFAKDFFRRWIKGTAADPAPTEFDLTRFVQAYRDAAGAPGVSSYPRIMNRDGVLNPRPAPATTGGALH